MNIVKINLKKPDPGAIGTIVDYLRRGKVVVLPTDTVYGLSCKATDKRAARRINAMKKSEPGKPLIKLVSSMNMAKQYARINRRQTEFLRRVWPGPVTVILEQKERAVLQASGKSTIGLRLPKAEFLTTIIKRLRQPIVSTSLNLSGDKNNVPLADIRKYFSGLQPDLVIDAGRRPKKKPSKILDIRDLSNIEIRRS